MSSRIDHQRTARRQSIWRADAYEHELQNSFMATPAVRDRPPRLGSLGRSTVLFATVDTRLAPGDRLTIPGTDHTVVVSGWLGMRRGFAVWTVLELADTRGRA